MPELLIYLIVILVGGALVWRGSELLESSATLLSRYYGLPPIVHGAMVVAIGSSFPELSSTVLSTLLHGEFELGLSVVVGSAVFNILVIPSLSGLLSDGTVRGDKELVYKDAQFYLISVAVLLLSFCFAVIYYPVDGKELTGRMNRFLALIPIALYGVYIFLQQQEVMEGGKKEKPVDINPVRQWLRLLLSLLLVVAGVEGLVRSAIFLGDFFDTPSFIWGITVLAAITSLPDAFISIRLARRDEGVVSLSNVLGSNIFDLLVAVPAGVLIAGSTELNFVVVVPLMAFLTLATIFLFAFLRTGLVLDRTENWVLLLLYACFVAWIFLETLGVSHFLKI